MAEQEYRHPGEIIAGKYRIDALIGDGGFGVVYRATNVTVGQTVALKFLQTRRLSDRLVVERFHREAHATSKLRHPHSIRVFDFGATPDGDLYIVMEHLIGRSLADAMAEGLSIRRAVRIAIQVCGALAEAHDLGIIHRDLKPENVYLVDAAGEDDFAKVFDFGVAKLEGAPRVTAIGHFMGSPAYMSPEQASSRPIDGRCDLYALGVILYQMVTGTLPFEGDTPLSVLYLHAHEPVPPVASRNADVPPELAAVIERLLAKEPDERFADAREAARALDIPIHPDLDGEPTPVPDVSTLAGPIARRGSRWLFAAAGLVVAAVLAVLVARPWAERVAEDRAAAPAAAPDLSAEVHELAPVAPAPASASAALPAARRSARDATVRSRRGLETSTVPALSGVVVRLSSYPAHATVFRGGQALGRAPVDYPARAGEEDAIFTFRLPGRLRTSFRVNLERSGGVLAVLAPGSGDVMGPGELLPLRPGALKALQRKAHRRRGRVNLPVVGDAVDAGGYPILRRRLRKVRKRTPTFDVEVEEWK